MSLCNKCQKKRKLNYVETIQPDFKGEVCRTCLKEMNDQNPESISFYKEGKITSVKIKNPYMNDMRPATSSANAASHLNTNFPAQAHSMQMLSPNYSNLLNNPPKSDSSLLNGKICPTPSNCFMETSNGMSILQTPPSNFNKKTDDKTNPIKQMRTEAMKAAFSAELREKLPAFLNDLLNPSKLEIRDIISQTAAKNSKQDEESKKKEEEEEDKSDWPFEWIGDDVKNVKDLIRIGREYKASPRRVVTNLDLKKLSNLVEPLETLDAMIGLEDIKASIFKQVIFHLQELDNKNKDMHHTVIKGPPGVGKTQISHIIARIYKGLGFLKKDTVVSVKRDDLIAGYLGQTAIKAKKKYEEALGGVLLIDEAYALGDGSDKDTYSKEAIDLLTSYLSEHGHEFICIIAGYKEALEKRFFSINEGLARRFNIHYEIKPYSGPDICQIFGKLVNDGEWQLDANANNPDFFVKHLDAFPHFGGDMQTLFAYTKKAHSARLLSVRTREELLQTKKKINNDDLISGFELYKSGNGYGNNEEIDPKCKFMYS